MRPRLVHAVVVGLDVPYLFGACDSSKSDGREGRNCQGADEHRCVLRAVQSGAGCLDHRGFLSWSGAVNAPRSGGASVIAQKPELSPAREDLAIRQESKRLPSSFCPSLADGYTAIGYASSNANTVNAPVT